MEESSRVDSLSEPPAQLDAYLLHGATLITPFRAVHKGAVYVRRGRIEALGPLAGFATHSLEGLPAIDLAGAYLIPGFVDIHVHGGGGADTGDGTEEALRTITGFHARGGTTSLLATLLSSDREVTDRTLESVVTFMSADHSDNVGARIVGVHLEGPYLSPRRAGAQNPAVLRCASAADVDRLLKWSDTIRIVTAAPEIEGGLTLGERLAHHGILPSIGHSDSYYPDVVEALEAGYRSVTHLYCDTPAWINVAGEKTLGLTESALLFDELNVELIADGRHVSAPLLQLAYKTKGADRICLITDAIRAAGMPPGPYRLGGIDIVVGDEGARRADGSGNAGSLATMALNVRTMAQDAGIPLPDVVRMAATTPARLLGLDRGVLAPGKAADITVLDHELRVLMTIVEGQIVFDRRADARPIAFEKGVQ